MYLIFTVIPLFSKAQIAFLRKELSEKEMPRYEVDILSIFATQVQQRLQQQEEKEKQLLLIKKQKQLMEEKEQRVEQKEHQQPRFRGEAKFFNINKGKNNLM